MYIRGFLSSFRHSNFVLRHSFDGFEVSFFEFVILLRNSGEQ
jgi:hypothetical protein